MYIYGASTLSEIVIDILQSIDVKIEGFFDDFSDEFSFNGIPLVGGMDDLLELKRNSPEIKLFVAVGDNSNREKIFSTVANNAIIVSNIIHPGAHIESTAELGSGNLIMYGSYIGSKVVIGNGNLIFPGVCITHHNRIGDFNFFSPNVSVGGYTKIASRCKIGMNSVVEPYIEVNSNYYCEPLTIVSQT
jgi:sugar O-acyltransferase (sialic acid O-acetyltransferase NeuD family)